MVESIGRYAVTQQNKLKTNFGAVTQTAPMQPDTVQVSQEKPKRKRPKKNFWEKNLAAISCITSIALVGILLLSVSRGQKKAINPETLLKKFEPNDHSPKGFKDVIGMDEAKEKLNRLIIRPLKSAEAKKIYQEQYGLGLPSGILFEGLPGNGKTFMAQALSHELGTELYMLNISDLGSKYIHETGGNIAKALDSLKEKAKISDKPVILFLDELDAISKDRTGDSKNHELEELNTILQNINDLQNDNIILIGATNKKNLIDPAILRPGRFAEHIFIENPNEKAIETFIKTSLKNVPKGQNILGETKDIKEIVKKMKGFSNADIKHVIENASRLAFEDGQANVGKTHFVKSIDSFVESRKMNEAYKARKQNPFDYISDIFNKDTIKGAEKWFRDYFSHIEQVMNEFGYNFQKSVGTAGSNLDNVSDVDKLLSKENEKAVDDVIDMKKVKEEIKNLTDEISKPPAVSKTSKSRSTSKKATAPEKPTASKASASKKATAPKNPATKGEKPEAKETILELKSKQKLNKKINKIKSSPNISKPEREDLINDAKQVSEIKLKLEQDLQKDIDRINNLRKLNEITEDGQKESIDDALKRYSDNLKQLGF